MTKNQRRRWISLVLVIIVGFITFSAPLQRYASFPDELRLFDGQGRQLKLSMPVQAEVTIKDPHIVHVNGSSQSSSQLNLKHPISLQTVHTGITEMQVKLFGKIPYKKVTVNVIPDLKVIPGGQTIGVKLKTAGILIVGHHLVQIADNRKVSPGEEAKIQVGDLIVSINGIAVNDVSKVSEIVNKAGESKQPLELIVSRHDIQMKLQLNPAYDVVDHSYRLGLYIRDSAAGVGTLTFYAPDQGVYGALGHVITDMDTQSPIAVGGGEIVHSNVTSIAKSQNGEPGEKHAQFFKDGKILGNIEKNTSFGIFGKMAAAPDHGFLTKGIPVAFAEEVKEGPAQIYTVLNGQKVEKFDIEIIHAVHQDFPATKGLVIKIVDPKLLDKTGGIVQGMSGSPIVQDGKMVGAITHVFVNDPTSGYGCYIEWMLQDAGVLMNAKLNKAG